MRVLLLTHRLPYPLNRGDRIRAHHLIRSISRSASLDLVSLVHDHAEEQTAIELREITSSVATAMVPRAQNLVRAAFALPGPAPLTHVLLHSPAIFPLLAKALRVRRPDVVLAYGSGMARYACQQPLSAVPFVLDMVDVDSVKWEMLGRTAAWPMSAVYRREAVRLRQFEVEATNKAFATTVVNDREYAALRAINPRARTEIVAAGVDLSMFQPTEKPMPSSNVVFAGVFNYEPNELGAVWLATEVWPLVRQRHADATLTLVGMNPTRRVRELAKDASVVVTGAVPDVRPYLWVAAVAAAPLTIARGVQNKVLESIAAGLPCVVTPQVLEGIPGVVRLACVSAVTAEEFAGAILDVLHAAPAERRGRANLARLDDLSWDAQLGPMTDLLEAAARCASPQAQTRTASSRV
ncbi:MAG: TIGR03087 family PEP-CTERM/XrtA system glycosyltransferase [Vicinamibacterales bacterium]